MYNVYCIVYFVYYKLVFNKIFFGEKNYKYFIGYLYHDNKVKPLHIILAKTKWKLNGSIFLLKMKAY